MLHVCDRHVRVVTGGEGDLTAFFDSALAARLEEWALVAPATAATRRVMLWDRPGIGRSDAGPSLKAPALISLLAEILTETAPAILVGHSQGALHVLCVALKHPELVAGLVLAEPSHPDQNRRLPASRDQALIIARAAAAFPGPVRSGLGSVIPLAGSALPIGKGTRAMTDLAPLVARRLRAVNEEHANSDALFSHALDLMQRKSLDGIPLEVLTGAHNHADDALSRDEWRIMHAELAALSSQGAQRFVERGHDLPFTAPSAVVHAIERVAAAARGQDR